MQGGFYAPAPAKRRRWLHAQRFLNFVSQSLPNSVFMRRLTNSQPIGGALDYQVLKCRSVFRWQCFGNCCKDLADFHQRTFQSSQYRQYGGGVFSRSIFTPRNFSPATFTATPAMVDDTWEYRLTRCPRLPLSGDFFAILLCVPLTVDACCFLSLPYHTSGGSECNAIYRKLSNIVRDLLLCSLVQLMNQQTALRGF